MRKISRFAMFLTGGSLYVLLEFLWRGRSHGSMFLLGGGCFLMLGRLRRLSLPLWTKALLGAAGITVGELVTGLLVNRDHGVWDYREVPMNFLGQICLKFSLLWILASLAGMWIYGIIEKRFSSTG